MAKKGKTAEERRHMSRVAEIGCILCIRLGYGETPAELHHIRRGAGMGMRSSHMSVIPLCPEHHRGNSGVHGLGVKGFEKKYGCSEADLLEIILSMV